MLLLLSVSCLLNAMHLLQQRQLDKPATESKAAIVLPVLNRDLGRGAWLSQHDKRRETWKLPCPQTHLAMH
jgi:hypothetical protein